MKILTLSLFAALAMSVLPLAANAAGKKCPDGKVYDPRTETCVTKRGS